MKKGREIRLVSIVLHATKSFLRVDYFTTPHFKEDIQGYLLHIENFVSGISKADILASRPFSSRGRRIYPLIRRTSYVSTDFERKIDLFSVPSPIEIIMQKSFLHGFKSH